jgi:hypothetical protein
VTSTSRERTVADVVRSMRSTLISTSQRDAGDLRRNASLYLARRAGTLSSSFEKGLVAGIDESQLRFLPYLGSLGFLIAGGLIPPPYSPQLKAALARAEMRSDHTDERAGLADDPVCAIGLLLLARTLDKDVLVRRLEHEILAAELEAPAPRLLASVVFGRAVGTVGRIESARPEALAAALLMEKTSPALRQDVFPTASADIAGALFSSVLSVDFDFAEDFGDMTILAALETSVKMSDGLPLPDGPCDIGVVVALKEEFSRFLRTHRRTMHKCERWRTHILPV